MRQTTFQHAQITLPTGAFRFRHAGEGRPVCVLQSDHNAVTHTMRALSEGRRVLAPLLPAALDADAMPDFADRIAAFIADAAGPSCDVVGSSNGGQLALWLAARHPAAVGRLVIAAPTGLDETAANFDRGLANQLEKIRAETLLLLGTEDDIVPAAAARLVASRITGSRLTYVYGAGHDLDADPRERAARLTRSFLDLGAAFMVPR